MEVYSSPLLSYFYLMPFSRILGAYYTGSATTQRLLTIPLAKYTESRVFGTISLLLLFVFLTRISVLDYRLAPETQFPGPFHDVVIGYMRLIEDLHIPPANIMIAGDSAGGALALALLMYLRDNAYPVPRAAVLMSPWVGRCLDFLVWRSTKQASDKTMSCESWDTNASFDVIPGLSGLPDDEMNPIHLYLGEQMQNYITHPYVSPLFGNLKGLPPLLIQAGEAEVLRDEITLLARKAALAGVFVRHEVYEDAVSQDLFFAPFL
jgi:acetyl esterase/lipase